MSKNILILSGPTHEYFDPVRFIGNASSGLMGKALAEEALARGYSIYFITGPVADSNLPNLGSAGQVFPVTSAEEMLQQAELLFPSSAITILAAAVADYAPSKKLDEKMAKSEAGLTLQLRATPDIAKTLGDTKRTDQITIGFALQTNDGKINARRKLKNKNLDGIILNTPASLGAKNGLFSFLSAESNSFDEWGCINKNECAHQIFQQVEKIIRGR
ncbi:MAG: phosphopantothenoylcysteine decarboxylase [Pontiella sp.]